MRGDQHRPRRILQSVIFRQTAHYLATGELPPKQGFEEHLDVMKRHLDLMVEVFGERRVARMFRKVALQYSEASARQRIPKLVVR